MTDKRRLTWRHRIGLFLALVLVCNGCNGVEEGPEKGPEKDALVAIKKASGQFERDLTVPEKPIVSIDLSGRRGKDPLLKHLRHFKALRELNLNGTFVTNDGLKELSPMANLRKLDLGYVPTITDEGLAHLIELKELETLSLVYTKITDAGLKHVGKLKTLKVLYLTKTPINGSGFRDLGSLQQLQELFLSDKASDVDLKPLGNLKELKLLWLGGSPIQGEGLKDLQGLRKLEDLNLAFTKVSDATLVHIKAMSSLRFLSVAGTAVTDAGLVHLKGLTKLERLHFVDTKITDMGIATLKKDLPKLDAYR